MTRPFLVVSLFLLAPLTAQHELQLTEVLVDPVGSNSGAQLMELRNLGPIPWPVAGWTIATSGGNAPMPNILLPGYSTTVLHVGASGPNSLTDIYLPSLPDLQASDTVALFRSTQITNAADLEDFVSWGGSQHNMALAVTAGQWPATFETVQLPTQEGCTIAHFDRTTYGSHSQASAWFRDCTPTIGVPNDGGGIFAENWGCPALQYYPVLGSGAEDNRPWVGESWKLDVYYLPPVSTTIFVAFGLDRLGSISLAPYGMPGCEFDVQPIDVRAYFMLPNIDTIVMQLPNNQALANLQFRMQALVPFPGANAANALPTRVTIPIVGSR